MTLNEAIAQALHDTEVEGIIGWDISPIAGFRRVQIGRRGCQTAYGCAHNSHDPDAPVWKLIPEEGRPSEIGHDGEDTFFLLANSTGERFFVLHYGSPYYDTLKEIGIEQIPAYVLTSFVA